jgi:cephalosporin hydroxylase
MKPGDMDDQRHDRGFAGKDYIAALQANRPELFAGERPVADRALHVGIIDRWLQNLDILGVDGPDRFQRITNRPWTSEWSAWIASGAGRNVRHAGVHYSYKGLIHLKPAIDLVLYSSLIWDLRPRTILEFGSLQGGSALWLTDQLDILCGRDYGDVHSFELCYECIDPRAAHPRLQFHRADFRDLTTLDQTFLARLNHPWLVIDDAHENVADLARLMAQFMVEGDYYVVEDYFLGHPRRSSSVRNAFSPAAVLEAVIGFDELGFVVDTKYTDAFGTNVTAAPNGWLIKHRRDGYMSDAPNHR